MSVLSIIIPSYNEAANICTTIEQVQSVVLPYDYEKEIIVVDDGSKDNTQQAVSALIASHHWSNITLLRHDTNHGKGMAIRTAINHITGDYVVIQDADNELDPNDFAHMLKVIIDHQWPVLYGSRFLNQNSTYSTRSFYYGARVLSILTNVLYRQHITDEATCYKMFRTDLLKSISLRCTGFEFCPEVTAKVGRRGIRIHEVPIHYSPRTFAEGKKIRATDGLKAIGYLLKYRFVK